MEQMIDSVSEALRGALSDIDHVQDLLKQERLHPDQQPLTEHELKRVLRAIEGNLIDTAVGFHMFMAGKDDEADTA